MYFELKKKSHLTLDIFNVMGERIETLLEDNFEPGYNQVIWNGGEHPSGIYLFQISSEGKTFTRKGLLLK